jgi:hypothetical protein
MDVRFQRIRAPSRQLHITVNFKGYRVIQPIDYRRTAMQIVSIVDKKEALATLKGNLKRHRAIVEEARAGYIKKAKAKLNAKLDELASGKLASLRFDLQAPEDHTDDYELAIRMLELHSEDTIEMSSTDVRTLMMDEWDWLRGFLFTNARYAKSAEDYGKTKGIL